MKIDTFLGYTLFLREKGHSVCWRAASGGIKMARLPRLRGLKLIKALHKAGFVTVRIKGSHHFLDHADGRCTVIPVHSGEIIGPGL